MSIFWTLLKSCHVDLITSQIYSNPNFNQFRAVFTKNDLVPDLVFGGYEYFRIVTIISHNDPPITVIMVFNLESFIIKLVDHPLLETWYNHLTKSLSISFLTDFAINQSETTLLNFRISTISIVPINFRKFSQIWSIPKNSQLGMTQNRMTGIAKNWAHKGQVFSITYFRTLTRSSDFSPTNPMHVLKHVAKLILVALNFQTLLKKCYLEIGWNCGKSDGNIYNEPSSCPMVTSDCPPFLSFSSKNDLLESKIPIWD